MSPFIQQYVHSFFHTSEEEQTCLFAWCVHCVSRARSFADDVAAPGLVLGARFEVSDGDLHSLDLLVFGRDGAQFVAHLVAINRDVLALDVRDVDKDVFASVRWRDKAVAFGAAEGFTHTSKQRTLRCPGRRGACPVAARGQGAGDEVASHRGRGALSVSARWDPERL